MIIPDLEGCRIGSGGSTILCIKELLEQFSKNQPVTKISDAFEVLKNLKILIIHAGGDSKRLPAYAYQGKLFAPVPPPCYPEIPDIPYTYSLFDKLVTDLQKIECANGQFIVVSGDALLLFDPKEVLFNRNGLTAVASLAALDEARSHGVFCSDSKTSEVSLYLQKPSIQEMQTTKGTVIEGDKALLDVGLMSFDAQFACSLLKLAQLEFTASNIVWDRVFYHLLLSNGIDFYREICCILGKNNTLERYIKTVRQCGSKIPDSELIRYYNILSEFPMYCQTVSHAKFLHFGTSKQLYTSGVELLESYGIKAPKAIVLNSKIAQKDFLDCKENVWIENCQIDAPLTLEGENVLTGVHVTTPLKLSQGYCLDIRKEGDCYLIRPYGIRDTFKDSLAGNGTFCNIRMNDWCTKTGIASDKIWEHPEIPEECTLWNANIFPRSKNPTDFYNYLFFLDATPKPLHLDFPLKNTRMP